MYRYTIWNIMNSLLKRVLQIFCSHNIIRSTLDMRNTVKAANSPAQRQQIAGPAASLQFRLKMNSAVIWEAAAART